MSKSHNKKRNVGIIFELLLRCVSSRLIENDEKGAQDALNIISKYFDVNSELYKEFRLFNALAKSTVSSSAVAAAILTEAKQASRRCNFNKLNKEKSFLIKEINHNLKDNNFYFRRVPDYTTYATIQTLLNSWRNRDKADLTELVKYESKIIDWLLSEKEVITSLDEHITENSDALIVKILSEKFNNAYTDRLNDEQKDIIRSYVFSIVSDNGTSITKKLSEIKERTLKEINLFFEKEDNKILLEKVDKIKDLITNESSDGVTDQTITRFLLVSQLKTEMIEGQNGQ
jgi:hypothetical protein